MRLRPVLAGSAEPYRYEREVEEFLRWSPHVRRRDEEARRGVDAGLFGASAPVEGQPDAEG
jgi:hypothetical protein